MKSSTLVHSKPVSRSFGSNSQLFESNAPAWPNIFELLLEFRHQLRVVLICFKIVLQILTSAADYVAVPKLQSLIETNFFAGFGFKRCLSVLNFRNLLRIFNHRIQKDNIHSYYIFEIKWKDDHRSNYIGYCALQWWIIHRTFTSEKDDLSFSCETTWHPKLDRTINEETNYLKRTQ